MVKIILIDSHMCYDLVDIKDHLNNVATLKRYTNGIWVDLKEGKYCKAYAEYEKLYSDYVHHKGGHGMVKIISIDPYKDHDLIDIEDGSGHIETLKRDSEGNWTYKDNQRCLYLSTSEFETMYFNHVNKGESKDMYRDKVILEISLKMLESGDSNFYSRLKNTVDEIMKYRDNI